MPCTISRYLNTSMNTMVVIVLVTCVFVNVGIRLLTKTIGVKAIDIDTIKKELSLTSFIEQEQKDGSSETDKPIAYDFTRSDTMDYATFPPDMSVSYSSSSSETPYSLSKYSGTKDPQDDTHSYSSIDEYSSYITLCSEFTSEDVCIFIS